MKYLPFAMTSGPLLARIICDACQDPRQLSRCNSCGALAFAKSDRSEMTVRCPSCSRGQQRVTAPEEVPWRLTPKAAEALRRTGTWLRRL
jgi:phage FluMu protein Com